VRCAFKPISILVRKSNDARFANLGQADGPEGKNEPVPSRRDGDPANCTGGRRSTRQGKCERAKSTETSMRSPAPCRSSFTVRQALVSDNRAESPAHRERTRGRCGDCAAEKSHLRAAPFYLGRTPLRLGQQQPGTEHVACLGYGHLRLVVEAEAVASPREQRGAQMALHATIDFRFFRVSCALECI
jgi:ribosomal protein S14